MNISFSIYHGLWPSIARFRTPSRRHPHWLFLALTLALLSGSALPSHAGFVYETPGEFLTSGDFNGDGILDVLVLDKATGNARVGYQDANGGLTWSAPLPTGVPSAQALAVGRFFANRDAIAVTSSELNRVHFVNLSNPSNAPPRSVFTPAGTGPGLLIGLTAPRGSVGAFDSLLVGSGDNDPDLGISLLEWFDLVGSALASYQDSIAQEAYLSSGNSLRLGADPTTFAAVMLRGSNDQFFAYSVSNHFSVLLNRPALPAGSSYVFGNFNNEPLPRFIFYVPGQSNILMQSLIATNSGFIFDTGISVTLDEAVQGVFYVQQGTDGSAIILFGDGVQGLTVPGGSPQLAAKYRSGAGAAGNTFTGVVPLTAGNFALLDGPPGSPTGAHSQTIHFNGSTYAQLSAGNLGPISTSATRANVWLFQSEPFVSSTPGFIASVNAPDWSSDAGLAAGSLRVRVESDAGAASGLGGPVTNNYGAAPTGAAWATPEQYRDFISLFTYSAPRPPEAINISISPAPGLYGGPIQVSFTTLNGGDAIFYRVGTADNWHNFTSPFSLSNDAAVLYYATNAIAATRSRLYSAAYSFGRGGVEPPLPPLDVAPGTSNPAPVFETNMVVLSDIGTVFYGRRSPLTTVGPGFFGPAPYLSFADSPFHVTNDFSYFYLETFEEGALTVPGVTPGPGWQVANPSSTTDSVDGDDAVIDGSGLAGHSYFTANQHSLTLTFDANALGGHFPTHVGIVWTDVGAVSPGTFGRGNVIFSARDTNGMSLGSRVGLNLGDGLVTGQTSEDRFFGIVNPDGISSVTVTMTNSINWEVDHLQYGYLPRASYNGTIWAINLDGSGETYITQGARPRVSRDGRFMAFLRDGAPFNNQGNLWLRDLDTGAEGLLFINTNILVGYDWDLTETNLIFDFNNLFWRIGFDGVTTQFPLASNFNQGAPSVNPVDGSVAFEILYPGPAGLYLAPPDVSSKQALSLSVFSPRWPSWAPDGHDLVFSDGLLTPNVDDGKNLWVLQLGVDYTNLYQITAFTDNTNGFRHGAVWSPESDALVGAGTMFNTNGIWVIPLTDDLTDCEGPPFLVPTSPGDPIDFVGSIVTAAAPPGVVVPGLFIRVDGDALVVYWSTAYRDFTLEFTSDLQPPTTWTPIPPPYFLNGYSYEVRQPLSSLALRQFYRLHYTGPIH